MTNPRIDTSRLAYTKSMPEILIGTLETRNQIDVPLCIIPHISAMFKTNPLSQPIFHELSVGSDAKNKSEPNQSIPSNTNPPQRSSTDTIQTPIKLTTSVSQQVV